MKASSSDFFINSTYLPEGQLLSTAHNREWTASLQNIERAMHTGAILEGMVLLCDNEMNLHVDFPSLPDTVAIIPAREAVFSVDGSPIKDIAILTRVGKSVCFKIVGMRTEHGKTHLTLSRRAAQAECLTHYLTTLIPGDIIPARVTHMESFGAFVDIGCGISSLLSVDTISVSRISHPKDRLYHGQLIQAVVKTIESGTDGFPRRIFISTKELLGTWEENAALFHAGQTVAGTIRSVEEYGVFVELTPNLAGLAELKEGTLGCTDPGYAFKQLLGHRSAVYIKSILPEKMKIKLVLIDTYAEEAFTPPPLSYFLPKDGSRHISRWLYSPEGAKKRIETIFDR